MKDVLYDLQMFACDESPDNRVVSVELNKHKDDVYTTTIITIKAMNDDLAHELDSLKYKEGLLEDYLKRELIAYELYK